jgi:nucleolar GTP-binding protein
MHLPIGNVPSAKELIDLAFRRATAAASKERGMAKQRFRTRLDKAKHAEIAKVTAVRETVEKQLQILMDRFPRIEELAPFYQDLMLCTIDVDGFRKSLGTLGWAIKNTRALCTAAIRDIKRTRDLEAIPKIRTACYGRVASMIKQANPALAFLEDARKTIRRFPSVRTTMPTVVIAGFPNVGKTTLLRALTGSEPEIAPYPFTTKQLMIGYDNDVQFIDTPGLLDRPLRKRNPIEKQAILALEHLAKVILFVIDPSEACGYSLIEQRKLLEDIRKAFHVPLLVVLNKADLLDPALVQRYAKEFDALVLVAEQDTGIEALRAALAERLRKA